MSKAGSSILKGAREALAFATGESDGDGFAVHVPAHVDVKAIRARLGLTQAAFAAQFGISPATLRNWERGGRAPDTASRAYLTVIAYAPDVVRQALRA